MQTPTVIFETLRCTEENKATGLSCGSTGFEFQIVDENDKKYTIDSLEEMAYWLHNNCGWHLTTRKVVEQTFKK